MYFHMLLLLFFWFLFHLLHFLLREEEEGNMAQKPQESELKRLNLENLRKQEDKSIKDILGNASHTTLYRFDNTTCQVSGE